MMDQVEILLTLAEVSVAFAGFATLASLFGRDRNSDAPRVDAMRMMNMLTTGLSACALALIPILFLAIPLEQTFVWQMSAAIALVWWASASYTIRRRAGKTRDGDGFSRGAALLNTALSIVASILFVVCVTGLSANPFVAYFAALLMILAVSGTLFFRLIASLFQH